MEVPHLKCISLVLPEQIKALLHVVQSVNEFLIPTTIDSAVYNDCQYVIHKFGAVRTWTTRAMDGAAERGRLDLVKWLSVVRNEGCTIAAMDGAAKNGHLKVVKWLYNHYVGRCSSEAFNVTAINGHFEVVKWLCRHNRAQTHYEPYVVTYGVQAVASAGDTNTLRALLKENCSWYYVGKALEQAASKGLTEIIKLLLTVKLRQANVSCALRNAVEAKKIEVVKVLVDLCSSSEIRAAYPNIPTGKIADFFRKTIERRDVEEKWGYLRTQHRTLDRMKATRDVTRNQDKTVSFCGLLRSWHLKKIKLDNAAKDEDPITSSRMVTTEDTQQHHKMQLSLQVERQEEAVRMEDSECCNCLFECLGELYFDCSFLNCLAELFQVCFDDP